MNDRLKKAIECRHDLIGDDVEAFIHFGNILQMMAVILRDDERLADVLEGGEGGNYFEYLHSISEEAKRISKLGEEQGISFLITKTNIGGCEFGFATPMYEGKDEQG